MAWLPIIGGLFGGDEKVVENQTKAINEALTKSFLKATQICKTSVVGSQIIEVGENGLAEDIEMDSSFDVNSSCIQGTEGIEDIQREIQTDAQTIAKNSEDSLGKFLNSLVPGDKKLKVKNVIQFENRVETIMSVESIQEMVGSIQTTQAILIKKKGIARRIKMKTAATMVSSAIQKNKTFIKMKEDIAQVAKAQAENRDSGNLTWIIGGIVVICVVIYFAPMLFGSGKSSSGGGGSGGSGGPVNVNVTAAKP